jgi:hypothetical protein
MDSVVVYTGTRVFNEWENTIATKHGKLILESNSFMYEHSIRTCNLQLQNKSHKILDNVNRNLLLIQSKPSKHYETAGFYFINCFNFSNSGHDLSIGLDFTNYILNKGITTLYILEGYNDTHNFKLFNLLLPECNWVELGMSQTYTFNTLHIITPQVYNIQKHTYLIDRLRSLIIMDRPDLTNRKIILIKSHRNSNVMNMATCYDCEKFINHFENLGFINIIPEQWDILELCYVLLHADTIITSEGSIVYTNQLFFNSTAKIVYMYVNTCNNAQLISKYDRETRRHVPLKIINSNEHIKYIESVI